MLLPLPQFATVAGEGAYQRGARLLLFVLDTRCTATLTDLDLELADHYYPAFIAAPDILPLTVDKLSAARRIILAALAQRRTIDARAPWPNAIITEDKPNEGPMAPLLPRPTPGRPPSAAVPLVPKPKEVVCDF